MRRKSEKGFSLMEMMVVLLIMSIIMAASAPIVSRKMSKSNGASSASPWIFVGNKGDIAYNLGGKKVSAIIGATSLPSSAGNPRLYIDCGDNSDAQITFGHGDQVAKVIADPINWKVGISNATIPEQSVAFGGGQAVSGTKVVAIGQGANATKIGATSLGSNAKATEEYSIAAGYNSSASSGYSIAIGTDALASGNGSIAIGSGYIGAGGTDQRTKTTNNLSVAIGQGAQSGYCATAVGANAKANYNSDAIAIGYNANANGSGSIAIGYNAKAEYNGSTAIGQYAQTSSNNEIVLGGSNTTVRIPGQLIVQGNVALATNSNASIHARLRTNGARWYSFLEMTEGKNSQFVKQADWNRTERTVAPSAAFSYSDKRLKNIDTEYTAGLEELKKLKLYNYTFKYDDLKTPQVGVIAQDLAEVFPNAVKLGNDGYLMIRKEDMFYAIINAVRELDAKISSIIEDITGMKKEIKELKEQNAEFQARITELEKLVNEKK